jgi:hypothetical protein
VHVAVLLLAIHFTSQMAVQRCVIRVSWPGSAADALVRADGDDLEAVINAACKKTGFDAEQLWAKENDAGTRLIALSDMEDVTAICTVILCTV